MIEGYSDCVKLKSECAYFEAKYQFENKVLESEEYYNSWIMVKVRKAHLNKVVIFI